MIPRLSRSLQHTQVPADLARLFAMAVRLGLRESIDYAAIALSDMEPQDAEEQTK